ncbi:hypothetical protein ACFFLZ_05165 [Photobacterium aphoticum]|uniref:HD domain-containing protein n=1 Tax=Photobacterium aphoticum TaxID=754436 RepID=UPI00069FC207|nr:hypothetical protein [Photobacterium aphoticum]PSU58714.1 hypothetical protein C9I90_05685 [Photobacterium aphoticum]GHA32562.1 hypothetical protein GCM10007086_02150 [Photobacterium aphoticum]
MPLSQRFTTLFNTNVQPLAQQCFEDMVNHYQEAHRHYHTLDHVIACLDQLDALIDRSSDDDSSHYRKHDREMALALWFHDVIYDPRRQDNEAQSADVAVTWLQRLNEPDATLKAVKTYILSTAHTTQHAIDTNALDTTAIDTQATHALLDIDLSILGAPPTQFQQYENAIRQEYHFVPDTQYQRGRLAVLEHFHAQPTLFRTPAYRTLYEQQAQSNLTFAIQNLRRKRDRSL